MQGSKSSWVFWVYIRSPCNKILYNCMTLRNTGPVQRRWLLSISRVYWYSTFLEVSEGIRWIPLSSYMQHINLLSVCCVDISTRIYKYIYHSWISMICCKMEGCKPTNIHVKSLWSIRSKKILRASILLFINKGWLVDPLFEHCSSVYCLDYIIVWIIQMLCVMMFIAIQNVLNKHLHTFFRVIISW